MGLDETSRRVVLAVLRHGPVARAELGRMLDLSAPSLTRVTRPLVTSGLLVEGEPVPQGSTGRPAVPLDVRAQAHHFVGAKVVDDALHAVVTDLKGTVVDQRLLPGTLTSPQQAAEVLAWLVEQWRGWRPLALGISLGAVVDDARFVSRIAFLGWPPTDLAAVVGAAVGLPVVVANDVHAFTLAEHWFGFGRGCTDFAVVTLGAGVGAGLVCGDHLVRGAGGLAGRVGDLATLDGRRMREVLETARVRARAAQALGHEVAAGSLVEHAADARLDPLREDVARTVGELVGQVGLVAAPQRVLVSGEGSWLLEGHTDALLDGIGRYLPMAAERVGVEGLGFDEWARGSAAVAIRASLETGR